MRAPNLTSPPLFGIVTCGWVKKPLKCGRVHLMRVGEKISKKSAVWDRRKQQNVRAITPRGKELQNVRAITPRGKTYTNPRGEILSIPHYNSL